MGSATASAATTKLPARFVDAVDYLHEQTVARVGLHDFGPGDYLEGLTVLLASLDERPDWTEASRTAALRQISIPLEARLHLEKGLREAPEAASHELPSPLFIIGAPRSGTTALHKLLAADEAFQGLESWLARRPMQRPPRSTWSDNQIFVQADRDYEAYIAAVPEIRAIHNVRPEEVDECIVPMAQSFVSNMFGSTLNAPEYDAWFVKQDMSSSLRRYSNLLKLVGYGCDRPWLLKNPSHVMYLETLLAAFPKAKVVQIHRDPLKTLPSAASLLYVLSRRIAQDAADPARIGRREFSLWREALPRALQVAEQHPERVLGVKEEELLTDPLALAKRIYDFADLRLNPEVEEKFSAWLQANPKDKHGRHVYTAEQFGLSAELLREAFSGYRSKLEFD